MSIKTNSYVIFATAAAVFSLTLTLSALAQTPPAQTCQLGDLQLESGEVIKDFRMTYITFGARSIGSALREVLKDPVRIKVFNIVMALALVAAIIAHLSQYYHLQPGDLIYTGTPEGVGPVVAGDVLEGSIEGVGSIALTLGAAE